MTPERWRQIEELYHAAQERGRGVLAGAEPDLRTDVERLLEQDSEGGLLDKPAAEFLDDPTASEFAPGLQLGPYRIEARLDAGGMGEVFRATDTRLGRRVAIKTCREQFSDRFHREARAISSLNHPHICILHDVGSNYLVMELIEGETLAARLKRGKLSLQQTIFYGAQVADALAAAQAKGIVHRDLKPANIMLTESGVKVLDFGLAKSTADEGLTRSRVVMGTPAYMAPEQREGKECDARTDIYALGFVLYEMATGKRWVTGVRLTEELPPALARIVSKCLENDRDLRYQHASEIRAALDSLKTTKTRSHTAKFWSGLGVAAAAVLVFFIADRVPLHGTPKLTDKDTIVLGDFENTTGDPVFDGTLRQGLAVQLQQSPFLSLISEQRVHHTLQLMGRPVDARLTPDVALQICERTASAAALEGSIASLGNQYVLGLRATNCHTGDVLDEEQAQAAKKEDVLNALNHVATRFRTKVGESLASVNKHDIPLQEATTPSIEALKAYTAASRAAFSRGFVSGIASLRHAIEIDRNFALAYATLGLWYSNVGESELAVESATKAYQLRDRASEPEKFFITAMYDRHVTGNLEKEQQTLELWAQAYPRDVDSHGLLAGFCTNGTGQYDRAIQEAKIGISLDPDCTPCYDSAVTDYIRLDRLQEAANMLGRASERKLEYPGLLLARYQIAYLRGDQEEMRRAVARAKGKPGAEDWISHFEALALARSGHLQGAGEMSLRAVELAEQAGERERAATYKTGTAVWDAFFGNKPAAKRSAAEALNLANGRDVKFAAAFALAVSGESSRPQALAGDLDQRFPEDTSVRFMYLPILRALFAMQRGRPAHAIELLQTSLPYELAQPGIDFFVGSFGALYSAYVRGEAYLADGKGAQAAAEFQKILNHRGIVLADPVDAMARLQLARAWALADDKAKAKAAYQDFLTLWKDADPNIPVLKQAKAEYARL
ncbi:MAG TPA: serine/threonine-protein kinase [Bryobacteraceae bacterium]|jgi:tetratricopeptide (TPR) repeat protein|nr:serine/threonine-protein kinase [Bryobacteraceae bacterium]